MLPEPLDGAGPLALEHALRDAHTAQAVARLRELAPGWYRQGRHRDMQRAGARLLALAPFDEWPPDLALWHALSVWYLAPAAARDQLQALARRQGLEPPGPPAAASAIAEELYLLAALFRAEMAMLAPPARLDALAAAIEARLATPARQTAPALVQLGGVTAALAARSIAGVGADALAALSTQSLALVARLDDRHSLCSAVALARWPLLRGEPALARETCELITVGLLAGDDAHMPLAHGWLMSVQSELALPGSGDLLRAWGDGSMDRAAVLDSPIAPMLLSALALLDAQAPRHAATDLQAVVLARQEHWTPFERWMARAARCWARLRDGDLPEARALLRLLAADAMPRDRLPGCYAPLLERQARWLELGGATAALPPAQSSAEPPPAARLPGPALLARLIDWACCATSVRPADLLRCDDDWRRHGLTLPLFAVPAIAQAALTRLQRACPGAVDSPWWRAAQAALALHATPHPAAPRNPAAAPVEVTVRDGLRIAVQGEPLAWGRKAPRRLLELVALLALGFPAEQPAPLLADKLYPDLDGDAALHALDTALYRLRRLLPAAALRRGSVGVAFDAAVVQVRRDPPRERWLPEFDTPWAEAARRPA